VAAITSAVHPTRASAANGDPIYIGFHNSGTRGTSLTSTEQLVGFRSVSHRYDGIVGESLDATGRSAGVRGLGERHGVIGETAQGSWGSGVLGRSDHANGSGIRGASKKGTGVTGTSGSGTGVLARLDRSGTGRALVVAGRNAFAAAGTVTFGVGEGSRTIASPVRITAASLVLATLQGSAGPGIGVAWADTVGGTQTIRIQLTAAATQRATVAFFVIEPD
jgi:hypothetical protein